MECPIGHTFSAQVLYHDFQKLFEVAVDAAADGFYREAIGSFASSHERFLELFIRVVLRTRKVPLDELTAAWKSVSKHSERQLGAFVMLHALEFHAPPPLMANAKIELRNKVIHQGYFPTREECLAYGAATLDLIRKGIRTLYSSEAHQFELGSSINDRGVWGSDMPKVTYMAYTAIPTNSPPGNDKRTLEQMVQYAVAVRQTMRSAAPGVPVPAHLKSRPITQGR